MALYEQGKGKAWWQNDDEEMFRQALGLLEGASAQHAPSTLRGDIEVLKAKLKAEL